MISIRLCLGALKEIVGCWVGPTKYNMLQVYDDTAEAFLRGDLSGMGLQNPKGFSSVSSDESPSAFLVNPKGMEPIDRLY